MIKLRSEYESFQGSVDDLEGQVFDKVSKECDTFCQGDSIVFYQDGKPKYILGHEQDCCEYVSIEDICGDLSDLENSPMLFCEESINEDPNADESATWTFYKFATQKGWVDIRFYGESNGYYSEDASLWRLVDEDRE